MKAFIIEDEPMARRNLVRLLGENFPDIEITGEAASVHAAVEWLKEHDADIIFMDVELSDGKCFEIFRQVEVDSFVVMTTAYDNYAVKAFEENAVDYLLKPVDLSALKRAVQRCRDAIRGTNVDKLLEVLQGSPSTSSEGSYKERFMLRVGERIVPVNASDIAFIISENKATYVVLRSGEKYIVNPSLDEAEGKLDPTSFFRVSRSCIIAKDCVGSIVRLGGSRLRIESTPKAPFEIEVARARVNDFLVWMEK